VELWAAAETPRPSVAATTEISKTEGLRIKGLPREIAELPQSAGTQGKAHAAMIVDAFIHHAVLNSFAPRLAFDPPVSMEIDRPPPSSAGILTHTIEQTLFTPAAPPGEMMNQWLTPAALQPQRRRRSARPFGAPHNRRKPALALGAALLLAAFAPPSAQAQSGRYAMPTATRAGDLQLGGAVALGNSTYNFNTSQLIGGAFYTTFDIRSHWGAEFNFRQTKPTSDSTVYERTYEIGPRVYVLKGDFAPYAKVMYGRGVYNFSNSVANIAYNIYTVGGGADFRVTRSINVRADYEYQTWPGFPLAALHPNIVTLGVAFHFHE
jgi:opacity protein-like surface antigen